MPQYQSSQTRVIGCLKDFLMWMIEYCQEKNPEILSDMNFIGHLERTKAAVKTDLEILEGKSPELQQSKYILNVPMMHQNLF